MSKPDLEKLLEKTKQQARAVDMTPVVDHLAKMGSLAGILPVAKSGISSVLLTKEGRQSPVAAIPLTAVTSFAAAATDKLKELPGFEEFIHQVREAASQAGPRFEM